MITFANRLPLLAIALVLWSVACVSLPQADAAAGKFAIVYQLPTLSKMAFLERCDRPSMMLPSVCGVTCPAGCNMAGAILPVMPVIERITATLPDEITTPPLNGFVRPPDPYPPKPFVIG